MIRSDIPHILSELQVILQPAALKRCIFYQTNLRPERGRFFILKKSSLEEGGFYGNQDRLDRHCTEQHGIRR